ncbi:hypothetical protein OB919_07465 [Halobacteria archaeon AArc-curdl1]|uniref:Uncharacterized protein n=1 Tax=Natronosalvus hydrolyticus TaxID=2979988 RepID=A0AAP2Z7M5_9EURY|nr:hypothetical protein [Halobacteria archaeon AArc-curdl1]
MHPHCLFTQTTSCSHPTDVSALSPAARAVVEDVRPTLEATLCHTVGIECGSTRTPVRSLERDDDE